MKLSKEQATEFFTILFRGQHHIPSPGVREWGWGWYVMHYAGADVATVDGDLLTRAVFLAHDKCIRFEITPGMRYLRLSVHARERVPSICEGHPTLEAAVSKWREKWPGNEHVPEPRPFPVYHPSDPVGGHAGANSPGQEQP